MKRLLGFILTLAGLSGLVLAPVVVGMVQSPGPNKYSRFGLSPYSKLRTGYEAPPIEVVVGGGKDRINDKLKIVVSQLENKTAKNIKAVKFKAFIFDRKDLNEALETVQTPLLELEVAGLMHRECDLLILYADDIPLLAYKPGQEFRLELAVAEVHYDDGTIWEAQNLPGKLGPPKSAENVTPQ